MNAEAADAGTFRHFSTSRNKEEAVRVLTCTHKSHYTPQHHECWKIKVYSCIWKESLCSDFLNAFSVNSQVNICLITFEMILF